MKNVLAILLAGGAGERLHPLTRDTAKPAVPFGGAYRIIDFPARLLPVSFAGQGLLDPELLTRLEVEGVTFHFLDDVLLLDFALEAAKGVF